MTAATPVIEMRDISKSFPGVKALQEVSFAAYAGEVHALVGENGAGKSTLIKILSGIYRPDSGSLKLNGQEVHFSHPLEALKAGVAVIHQEFSLLPERSVAQNIFLGREPVRRGLIDRAAMLREAGRALEVVGARIDPNALVRDLDVASQQMVEIAKAVSLDARVLVLDEPTAALNEAECEILFGIVDRLKAHGVTLIYITHRMREVERLASRVTALKDGKLAASFDHRPATNVIVRSMVGRDISDFYAPAAAAGEIGAVMLEIRKGSNRRLHDISLSLHSGEIVGLAGIQGAGRAAVAQAIFGAEPFTSGDVFIAGERVHFRSPREAIRAGVGLLPGDRKGEGLSLMQSVHDNGMITSRALSPLAASHRANRFTDGKQIDALFDRMDLRAASYDEEIRLLSGGNQQKAILARWLSMKPRVLIFIEPTRGIDVSAKVGIYHLMRDLARAGTAIMMVSSDLPEVLGVSDRILVMRDGRIVEEFGRGASEEQVMTAATGHAGVRSVAA